MVPTSVLASDAAVPLTNIATGNTPMLVNPASTKVAPRNGMIPAMTAVLTPGPNRGRMAA